MATYRIIGEHLVSEAEFAEKADALIELATAAPAANVPSITLANKAILSVDAFAPQLDDTGTEIAFPPVEFGKPLTIDIRGAYTGRVGSQGLLSGTGDIAVVSGVKAWSAVKASARALNFIKPKTGRHTLIASPGALNDGTRVVAYQKAVATSQLTVTFEIRSASHDGEVIGKLGEAFTAAAGIPLFLPYAGVLLAAGKVLPLAGNLVSALSGGPPHWSQSEDLSIDLPGYEPVSAGLRVVAAAASGLDQMRYVDKVGLVDATGNPYRGDEPYVVIAVYGGARPELDGFTAAALTADLAARFYPAKDGFGAAIDDVIGLARVASDWTFRKQADALRKKIAGLPADSEEKTVLDKQLAAVEANIDDPIFRGSGAGG